MEQTHDELVKVWFLVVALLDLDKHELQLRVPLVLLVQLQVTLFWQ